MCRLDISYFFFVCWFFPQRIQQVWTARRHDPRPRFPFFCVFRLFFYGANCSFFSFSFFLFFSRVNVHRDLYETFPFSPLLLFLFRLARGAMQPSGDPSFPCDEKRLLSFPLLHFLSPPIGPQSTNFYVSGSRPFTPDGRMD